MVGRGRGRGARELSMARAGRLDGHLLLRFSPGALRLVDVCRRLSYLPVYLVPTRRPAPPAPARGVRATSPTPTPARPCPTRPHPPPSSARRCASYAPRPAWSRDGCNWQICAESARPLGLRERGRITAARRRLGSGEVLDLAARWGGHPSTTWRVASRDVRGYQARVQVLAAVASYRMAPRGRASERGPRMRFSPRRKPYAGTRSPAGGDRSLCRHPPGNIGSEDSCPECSRTLTVSCLSRPRTYLLSPDRSAGLGQGVSRVLSSHDAAPPAACPPSRVTSVKRA